MNNEELKGLQESIKKTTALADKIAMVTFLVAVVQLLVAIFQLILSFAYSPNPALVYLGSFMVIAAMVILIVFSRKLFKTK